MAKMAFKAGSDYALKLSQLATDAEATAKKALYAAASITADKIRENLTALPTDNRTSSGSRDYYFLSPSQKHEGVPPAQKEDLLESLGVTPMSVDRNGDYNVKIGFDGYGSQPTAKYPNGIPNQMLARAIESGSSVRDKTPFVRPAVKSVKGKAIDEMNRIINEACEKVMKK